MRAVLDTNVIVAALLSANGAPAAILTAWRSGAFELVMSPMLASELRRVLVYPKLRRQLDEADAVAVLGWLEEAAVKFDDPTEYPLSIRSGDPADDYLLALAAAADAVLVTGADDLLELGEAAPIHTPRGFVASLRT